MKEFNIQHTYNQKISVVSKLLLTVLCVSPMILSAQYTEKDIRNYIAKYQDIAIHKMTEYGIPASITIAQGIFESACGTSHLAVDGNNHFGIKCHTDWTGDTILIDDDELQECFRKYVTVEESYNDHSLFLKNRKRYANLFQLDIMDYPAWARTLKADGYATNPKYADQLISIIQRYNIARLDTIWKQGKNPETIIAEKLQSNVVDVNQEKECSIKKSEVRANNQCKVFTAIGSDFPSGTSPFSYRKVFENNKTYFIIAKKGDTYETIAGDVQVASASLRKFNDVLDNTSQPVENEIVYIESKAKSNSVRVHIVQQGETLRYIAQRYGIQLDYLFKYNNLTENSIIHPGDQILLKH